jgi:hypothetical protein
MHIAKSILVAVLAILVLPAHYPQDLLLLQDCYELSDCVHASEQVSGSCYLQLLYAPEPLSTSSAKQHRVAVSPTVGGDEATRTHSRKMVPYRLRPTGQLRVPDSDLPTLI